jgi:hypothetical protein
MRKLISLGIALLLGAGLTAVQSQAAQAAPCTPASGYLEGWDTSNTCTASLWEYWGQALQVGHCVNLTTAMRATSYVWNNSSQQWRAWTGTGCTSSNAPLYAHTAGGMGAPFNNNIHALSRDS